MKLHFYKYQATGNDFVIIDNRTIQYSLSREQIEKICHRKFGIGADGLMLIENHPSMDFNLVYYNSDGSQSLCGNGSRAAVHMAGVLKIINDKAAFNAYDGEHTATRLPSGEIQLRMNDVASVTTSGNDFFINTGSPHHVRFVTDILHYPVVEEGRTIRYSTAYQPGGTNVNFVELLADNTIFVRTYERGVEDETLSCGTGVVAAALAASFRGYKAPVNIKTRGGDLVVAFNPQETTLKNCQNGAFTEIYLIGPAKLVFEGDLDL